MFNVEVHIRNLEKGILAGNIFTNDKCEYTILKNKIYTIAKCYGVQRISSNGREILNQEDACDFISDFRENLLGGNVYTGHFTEEECNFLLFEDFVYK